MSIYPILAWFNGSWPGSTVQFTAFFLFELGFMPVLACWGCCDEKDFMSARVGAIVFPNPNTVYPDSPSARFIFFGFSAFVLGKKKEESEMPKREEEQRR
jgi:hypothetical protein